MTESRMANLRRANETRIWLAEQKRAVKAGDTELWCSLVVSADERLRSLALIDFLMWLPKVGEWKAERMIREAFPFPTERTRQRRPDRVPLDTSLRLAALAREICDREAMNEMDRVAA